MYMNKLPRYLMIGATVLGFSVSAYAADQKLVTTAVCECPVPPTDAKRFDGAMPDFEARQQEHLKQLHDSLKLSASQEKAWTNYVAVISQHKDKGPKGERPNAKDIEAVPALERMEKRLADLKEREKCLTARLAATKTFYAKLNAEQKVTFDKESFPPRRGPKFNGPRVDKPVSVDTVKNK